MIRTSSSNRLQVTVVSAYTQDSTSLRGGAGAGAARQPRPPPQPNPSSSSGPSSSLLVILGVVVFLALVGIFFLNRLQRSFELADEAGGDFDGGDWGRSL